MPLSIAIAIGNFLGWLSRITGRGSGIMVTGRTILALQPRAAALLARDKEIVLISGTNGKTTTLLELLLDFHLHPRPPGQSLR